VVSSYQQGVNAGGASYKDALGDTRAADQRHASGGWGYIQNKGTKTTTHAITKTGDAKLYQSQRVDPYAYQFEKVPNGIYQVELRFAELDNIGVGERLFDVIIENTLALPAHDIRVLKKYLPSVRPGGYVATDGRNLGELQCSCHSTESRCLAHGTIVASDHGSRYFLWASSFVSLVRDGGPPPYGHRVRSNLRGLRFCLCQCSWPNADNCRPSRHRTI
jgi:hypothetical protein